MPTTEQVLSFLQTLFPGQLVLYPPQLAQVMGRSEKALKHLIDRGCLPFEGRKIGNRWCVDVFRVAEWLVRGEKETTERRPVSSENPTKPTRTRSSTPSRRTSMGGKLLEMRQAAAAAMRRTLGEASGDETDTFVLEFIDALLQPESDDDLTLDVSLTLAGDGSDEKAGESHEIYVRLSDAAERVVILQRLKDVVAGQIVVSRNSQSIYICSRKQAATTGNWGAKVDCDSRFSAMLAFIENQALEVDEDVSHFSDERVPAYWFASQSLDVRRQVRSLCTFSVEKEFFQALANRVPVIQDAELLSLYHDAWSCLPSRLAFEVAVTHLDSVETLNQYISDAEVALSAPHSVKDFEDFFRPEDELDVVWNWLRERAYQVRL